MLVDLGLLEHSGASPLLSHSQSVLQLVILPQSLMLLRGTGLVLVVGVSGVCQECFQIWAHQSLEAGWVFLVGSEVPLC